MKNFKEKIFAALLSLALVFTFAGSVVLPERTVLAQGVQCGDGFEQDPVSGTCIPKTLGNPSNDSIAGQKSVMGLILAVLKILLTVVGVIAVVLIVVGGFQYMTAGGNEEQAEKGRKAITNAVIGLIVVILAYTIVYLVTRTVTVGVV